MSTKGLTRMTLSLTYRSRVDMCNTPFVGRKGREFPRAAHLIRSCDATVTHPEFIDFFNFMTLMLPSCLKRLSPIGFLFLRRTLSIPARRPPKMRDPSLCISPSPYESFTSPNEFLKAIGRKSETKISFETWTQFWKMGGGLLRKAGVSVKDRRYGVSLLK